MSFDARPVRHAYEAIADEYAQKFGNDLDGNEFDRAVIDAAMMRVQPDGLVLDVGCGPAQVAERVLEHGHRAVGFDLTPAMLAVARRRASTLPLVCGDVLALPFRSGSAAAVVAWYSLHNLPRQLLPLALAEIRRVLRPGALLVIATHQGTGEESVQRTWKGDTEAVVITYYEAEELSMLVAQHGFEVSDVRHRPPLCHEHQVEKLCVTGSAI